MNLQEQEHLGESAWVQVMTYEQEEEKGGNKILLCILIRSDVCVFKTPYYKSGA